MTQLTERLRDAADRVSRHCFKQPGDSGLMSIPANPERDVDLLLVEAAGMIDGLLGVLETIAEYRLDDFAGPSAMAMRCVHDARDALAGTGDQPSPAPTDADLLDYGYAPGNYTSICYGCSTRFYGADKRCRVCRPCAVSRWKARAADNGSDGS